LPPNKARNNITIHPRCVTHIFKRIKQKPTKRVDGSALAFLLLLSSTSTTTTTTFLIQEQKAIIDQPTTTTRTQSINNNAAIHPNEDK
jgi:hypothetical protein